MKLRGFHLVRIGGISLTVDYSWIVIFLLILIETKNFFEQTYQDYPVSYYWMLGGIASMLVFFSVLVRELAHSFVATKFGTKIKEIRLHIFGSVFHGVPESKSARQEFVIALSGWMVNVAIGCFGLGLYLYLRLMQETTPVAGIAACLAAANAILAILHMIPGFPLDGGRVLRAILWDRWDDLARATKVVSQIGNALALFLIIFGILQFLVTLSWFAVLIFVTGLLMKQSALENFQSIMQQQALADVPVDQVMTDKIVIVDWLLSVKELVQEYFYKHRFTHFPVYNREEFIGMVSLDGVKSVSRDLWTFKQVRDIMVPIESVACARPKDSASEILKRMKSENIGCMPVMENGKLAGIVTRGDITNLLKIKSDLGPG